MNETHMKMPHARSVANAILFASIFLVGCSNKNPVLKTTISVALLKKAALDTAKALTLLQILYTYPAQMECNADEKYANIYVCRKFTDGDTVYVFEECKKVPAYALDTTLHYAAVVDKNNIIVQCPDKFTVFIPSNFRMAHGAKYFVAKLDFQTEY